MQEVISTQAAAPYAAPGHIDAVADASDTLLAENYSREAFIVSADTADVWLSYGTDDAVVGTGHCVRAGGPAFREESWRGEVHYISHGAAKIGVTELSYAVGDDEGEQPAGAADWVPSGPSDTAIPPPTAPPPGTPVEG